MHHRSHALAAVLALAAGPALAGGFAEPVATAPLSLPAVVAPLVTAPTGDWTGGFVGVQLGYGDIDVNDLGDGEIDSDIDVGGDGALLGLNAGYNRDFGRFVLGGEVQYDSADIAIEIDEEETGIETQAIFRAGVRAGYDAGRFMPYLTGGYASAGLDTDANDATLSGGYYGVGVDYRLSDRITLGAQVLQHDFEELEVDDISDSFDVDVEARTFNLRATYNF